MKRKWLYKWGVIGLVLINLPFSGCYKEPDLISDLSESVGKVAQVSVVWLGSTRTTTANNTVVTGLTVEAGTDTFFNIEFTSDVTVKEFRIYTAAAPTASKTLLSTIPSGAQVYDPALRCYALRVPITAPVGSNTVQYYFAEVLTINGLASDPKSAILRTFP
jgi:hypothetical protein